MIVTIPMHAGLITVLGAFLVLVLIKSLIEFWPF